MRICTGCKESKPLDSYYMNGPRPHAKCKACTYAAQKIRVSKNKESVAAYQAKYYRENESHLKAYYADYRDKHKERLKQIKAASADWWREYNKAYHLANHAEIRQRQKEYKTANKSAMLEYRNKNKERDSAKQKEWARQNKHLLNARAAKRRFALRRALPAWADLDKIAIVYAEAQKAPGMHVDHIVPLQSDLVCGLHVHHNLQILPATVNLSKGNYHWPDMPD